MNGKRYTLPPAAPADWPLPLRERHALGVLADVAAIQFEALPEHSLVRRLLETPISELDLWGSDPRYAGRSLGLGAAPRRNRPRPGSIEDRHALDILRMRQEGRTQREIADALGCSQSAVFHALHRMNGATVAGR